VNVGSPGPCGQRAGTAAHAGIDKWFHCGVETPWIDRHRVGLVAAAAISPLLVCAGLASIRDSVTAATSALVLVLLVVAVAATGERIAGFVAALSCGVWFDVFLTEPFGQVTIKNRDDIEVTVLLVLVGVSVTEIALWGRRQQARASRRAGYLDGVLGTSKIIAGPAASPTALITHVAEQIARLLDIDDCYYVAGAGPGSDDASLDHDGRVTRRGHLVNVERHGLPTEERIGLIVRQGAVIHGQFMLTAATRVVRPSIEQLRVAVLLADQVGAALTNAH
jgi:K+-sensing histidine kinase KdpD